MGAPPVPRHVPPSSTNYVPLLPLYCQTRLVVKWRGPMCIFPLASSTSQSVHVSGSQCLSKANLLRPTTTQQHRLHARGLWLPYRVTNFKKTRARVWGASSRPTSHGCDSDRLIRTTDSPSQSSVMSRQVHVDRGSVFVFAWSSFPLVGVWKIKRQKKRHHKFSALADTLVDLHNQVLEALKPFVTTSHHPTGPTPPPLPSFHLTPFPPPPPTPFHPSPPLRTQSHNKSGRRGIQSQTLAKEVEFEDRG